MADTPLITEFLASNDTSLDDEDGDDSDWIEIYNPTSDPVNLGGWYLTDNQQDLDKWRFPSTTLAPGEFLVVFASDKNRAAPGSALHTNFKLDADGEYVALVMPDGTIASEVMPGGADYPPQQTDISYGLSMPVEHVKLVELGAAARVHVPQDDQFDDSWMNPNFDDSSWVTGAIGIGYQVEPFAYGYGDLINTPIAPDAWSVYIRIPFLVADPPVLDALALRMKYDDGFVAYLNGTQVASSNAPDHPQWDSKAPDNHSSSKLFEEFSIPDFQDHLVVGENVLAVHGLDIGSELLRNPDLLVLPELVGTDVEITENEPPGLLAMPTPGRPNGTVVQGFAEQPAFSAGRGFYEEPIDVALVTPTLNAEIRYTIDGSPPTETHGSVYTGTLKIDRTTTLRAAAFRSGYAPSPVTTSTYLFVDDIVRQDNDAAIAAGFPPNWGERPADYEMDPDVVGPNDLFGGVYAATIRDDLRALPSLSIAISIDDMFGPLGIYTNPQHGGADWERAASVELIDPADQEEFQADIALRIHGGASRGRLKQSLRLLFKGDYGPPMLEHPFFGPDAADRHNTIVLRMEFNDGLLEGGRQAQYARDEFARRTQLAMGRSSAHGRYLHVYINGIYWGMYNAVERPDSAFASSYYGGEREEWDAIKVGNRLLGDPALDVLEGDLEAWNMMLSLSQAVFDAPTQTEKAAAFMRLQGLNPDGTDNPAWESYLNVDNYIDYMIVNFYGGNNDWPFRNWYAARRRGPDSEGFVFHVWDAEWTLNLRSDVHTNRTGVSEGVAEPYSYLRSSDEFRIRFSDRVQEHFSPGGALYVNPDALHWNPASPENNVPAARYFEVTDEVRRGLVGESARWGDVNSDVPVTVNEDWQATRDDLLQNYFPVRSANVLSTLRRVSGSPFVNPPLFSQRGGEVAAGYPLELEAVDSLESIYYTLDGSDPRLIGGGINPAALEYTGPISVTDGVTVRARAIRTDPSRSRWSAIEEAEFRVATIPSALLGDYDGNGSVGQSDLDLVLLHWGQNPAGMLDGWIQDMHQGTIDQHELDKVLLNWGSATGEVQRVGTDVGPSDTNARVSFTPLSAHRWPSGEAVDEEHESLPTSEAPLERDLLEMLAHARLSS